MFKQKELSIRDIQICALKILKHVAQFCDDKGLKYSLAYGTLIGAVRHQGFIPWDDDIDIIMPREDYDTFVKTYDDSNYPMILGDGLSNHLHVVISDSHTQVVFESQYDSFYYKAGIWLDIFPIDLVPDNKHKYVSLRKRLKLACKLQHMAEISIQRNNVIVNFFSNILHAVLFPFKNIFGNYADGLMKKWNNSNSLTCDNLSLWYLNYPPFAKKWMNSYTTLFFEGQQFQVISDYHEFLTKVYGDYMQLPPEEQRIPRHSYKAYYK